MATPGWIADEAKHQTGVQPVRCVQSKHNRNSFILSFEQAVRTFKILHSTPSKLLSKAPHIGICDRCHGYHFDRVCNRMQRCNNCGEKEHGNCDKPTQCMNCKGPHPAKRVVFCSKKELSYLRKMGIDSFMSAQADNVRNGKEDSKEQDTPPGGDRK